MSTYQQRRAEWEERRARERAQAAQREVDAQRKREQRLAELAALYAGDAVDDISPSPLPARRKGGEYDAHGNFVEGRLTHAQKRERREKALKMLRETNMTQAQVAAAFHVSPSSVYLWAQSQNIPSKNKAHSWSLEMCQRQSEKLKRITQPEPQRVALAVQMYNEGAKVQQIMKAVNAAKATVYEWAHKYGGNPQARAKALCATPTGRKPPDPQRVALAVQMYNEGAHIAEIAKAVHAGQTAVYEWAHKYGGNPQARAKAMDK